MKTRTLALVATVALFAVCAGVVVSAVSPMVIPTNDPHGVSTDAAYTIPTNDPHVVSSMLTIPTNDPHSVMTSFTTGIMTIPTNDPH